MRIADTYYDETVIAGTPNFAAVVPSDSTVLSGVRAVYCVTAGTLQADNGSAVVPIAMTAGQTIAISPVKIRAATTGTYVVLQ